MTQAVVTQQQADIMEQVIIKGDLSQLTPQERVNYYRSVCQSIGLNPLTKPFDYINLNGKLTLYAKKDAADQLRAVNGVSISKPDITFQDDLIIVTIAARDKTGREDSDIGVVRKTDMRGDVANALMKAVTKAKRRVTLSLCGLGWLDETEIETIPDARPVPVDFETGVVIKKSEQHASEPLDDLDSAGIMRKATPAPEPEERKSYRTAGVKFNGLKPDAWHTLCGAFANEHANWQNKDGGADMNHILASAGHAGYQYITADNVAQMFIDIVRLHEAKAQ